MKAFVRKIRSVKTRELIENTVGTVVTIWTLRYGQISHTPEPSPFFGNFNQSNQHIEKSNPYHQTIIVDEDSQSLTENQSFEKIRRVKFGFDRGLRMADYNRDSSTQKSEFTYSQDEIEALGLGQVNEEVRSVVGLSMPRSSQFPLAGHEKNGSQLIQESNLAVEQPPKLVMSRTSTDVTNQKWIQEFICSIRAGSNEELDEQLIKSILGKVAESELDIPSINKILQKIVSATLSVASNEKLLKIFNELQKPIQPSVPQGAGSTEVVTIPDKLPDYQQESKSSSSIFVEGIFVEGFQQHPLPHMDPIGWLTGKYDNKALPPTGPEPTGVLPTTGLQMEKPASMPQPEYSALTKSEKRMLADPKGRDGVIQKNGFPRLDLRFNQIEFKTPKHGPDHGLPVNDKGKTPKTEANVIALRDSLLDMPNKENIIWYTEGQYQGGTPDGREAVNLYDPEKELIAVYTKQNDGSYSFLTTCKLIQAELDHLIATNGNFVTEKVLAAQTAVSIYVQDDTSTNINDANNNNNGVQ